MRKMGLGFDSRQLIKSKQPFEIYKVVYIKQFSG